MSGWRGALRLDEVIRLSHPKSIIAAVTASLLAATLAQDITRELNAIEEASVAIPPEPEIAPASSSTMPPSTATPTLPEEARVRTFFAIALQLARSFPTLVALANAVYSGDRLGMRRAGTRCTSPVLDEARDVTETRVRGCPLSA